MTKVIASYAENAKKRIRDLRQKAMDSCKTELKDLDIRKQCERELQTQIEKHCANLEKAMGDKQKELLKN